MPEQNGSDQNHSESLVAALVGEGKKYSNLEELAKSRVEADNFIETLKEENAALRGSAQQQTTIKDVMDAIKSQKDSNSDSVTPLDDEDLQKRISEMLEQRDGERTRKSNRAEAKKLVSDKLNGDEVAVDEYVKEKARSLGLTEDSLWKLSEESPSGFANLVGLAPTRPNTGNPNALPHHKQDHSQQYNQLEIDGIKTKKWFDEQRRTMGNRKFLNDRQMQLQQIAARTKLGDRYYS